MTSGPTSQEGIAMDPDGKSFITSVGSPDSTVWLHNKDGDHQIASEGNAVAPSFSSDGNKLYFLMANGQTRGYELWVTELNGGKVERLLPGYSMAAYSVSRDGKAVAFAAMTRAAIPVCGLRQPIGAPHRCASPQRQAKILRISYRMAILFFAQSRAARILSTA